MVDTKAMREDVYLKAYKTACEELAELVEEYGTLQGRMQGNRVLQDKLRTEVKVYERRIKELEAQNKPNDPGKQEDDGDEEAGE